MSYRHRMAEAAIRDLPAIKKDYDSYRLMLDARALAGGCLLDEPPGAPGLAAGDRYLDRYDDPVLRKLFALLEGIYEPYSGLAESERRVLALRCWQNMDVPEIAPELGFTERHTYRLLDSAFSRLYQPLLSVQPLLEEWRCGHLK